MATEGTVERSRQASALWGGTFVLGLVVMVIGVLALIAAVWTGVVSIVFLGIMLALSGVAEIAHAIRTRREGGALPYLLGGILSGVIGVVMAARPAVGLAAVTLLLIGYLFTSGLFRGVTSLMDRYPHWGWDFLYALCAVVLGVILVANWPASAVWLVGTLVGLEILFRGAALLGASLTLRREVHRGEEARVSA